MLISLVLVAATGRLSSLKERKTLLSRCRVSYKFKRNTRKKDVVLKMAQTYWDPLVQYTSYIFLGLSVSIGLLALILVRDIKRSKRRRKNEEKRLKDFLQHDATPMEQREKNSEEKE